MKREEGREKERMEWMDYDTVEIKEKKEKCKGKEKYMEVEKDRQNGKRKSRRKQRKKKRVKKRIRIDKNVQDM